MNAERMGVVAEEIKVPQSEIDAMIAEANKTNTKTPTFDWQTFLTQITQPITNVSTAIISAASARGTQERQYEHERQMALMPGLPAEIQTPVGTMNQQQFLTIAGILAVGGILLIRRQRRRR